MQAKHHFINFIALGLILSCAAASAVAESSAFRLENGVLEDGTAHRTLDSMSPEGLAEALPRLRMLLDSHDSELRAAVARALLEMDDRKTVESLARMYHDGNDSAAYDYLESYGKETIIPYAMDDIYRKSRKIFLSTGGMPLDIRFASSSLLLTTIERSGRFPAATEAWAKATHLYLGVHFDSRVIDQEMQWWEHNKGAILAGQYERATWLPATTLDVGLPKRSNSPPTPSPHT